MKKYLFSLFFASMGSWLYSQVAPPPPDFVCEKELFSEDFESGIPAGWQVNAGLLYMGPLRPYAENLAGWFLQMGPTQSPGTGPDGAYEGQYYAYCEGSGPIARGAPVTLTSPEIQLNISATINISFALNMFGPSASLAVNVIENGIVTNVLPPVPGGIHASDEWEQIHIDISEWRTRTIQIQFEAIKPPQGANGDISIDAVLVCGSQASVPTLSEWAVIVLSLILLIVGTVAVKHKALLAVDRR